MKNYHSFNFFKHTYCEFKLVGEEFFKEKLIHFKSKSGSKYFYTDIGVYRYSNHWGRVANCRWKINGIENYKNQNYYIGYANWFDFHSLNSSNEEFYLEVDYEKKEVVVKAIKSNSKSTKYLMTLSFALKRKKEITTIFKGYKWASYFYEDIEVLREKLIVSLINSHKTLQVIKQTLKRDLE